MGFCLERTAFDRGETVEMLVAARNDSRVPITGMKCQLVEEAEWKAKTQVSRLVEVLRTMDMPRFVLDACLVKASLDLQGRPRTLQTVGEAAEQQLTAFLLEGGGCRLRVTIPRDAAYCLTPGERHIKLGRLSTYVVVGLETNTLGGSPSCRHPITVVPGFTTAVECDMKTEEPVAVPIADRDPRTSSARFVNAVFVRVDSVVDDADMTDVEVEDVKVEDVKAEDITVEIGNVKEDAMSSSGESQPAPLPCR